MRSPILSPRQFEWTLATFVATLLPHMLWLPRWLGLLLAAIVVMRWAQRRRYGRAWPGWIKFPLLIAILGLIVTEFGNPLARQAGTAALLGLVTLKVIEAERVRDGYWTVTVCLFLVSVQFLFNDGLGVTLYMLVPTLLAFLALNEVSAPPGTRGGLTAEFGRVGREIGALLLVALPLTIFLFLSVPRLSSPMWGTRENAYQGKTGLGDTMAPGSITELLGDDTPVMRVRFDGKPPPRASMYWRGPVLWNFDGQTWTVERRLRLPNAQQEHLADPQGANAISYQVTLEATDRNGLYLLDLAARTPADAFMLVDGQVVRDRPVRSLYAYSAASVIDAPVPVSEYPSLEHQEGLALPPDLNPRTAELARSWRAELGDDRMAIANRALRHIRTEEFSYSLGPPPLVGAHRMDEFLFDTRSGFCEHYAAAFVVLMRNAGVPARVVTGYLSGYLNQSGSYYLVRNSDAHAWAEILIEDQGWVRVDPTAAINPDRINQGLSGAGAGGLFANSELLRGWRERIDNLRAWWNETVVRFDALRQSNFFSSLGIDLSDWRQVAAWMATGLAGAGLLSAALIYLRRERVPVDQALRRYRRYLRRLESLGIRADATEGATTLAARVGSLKPALAHSANAVARAYEAARYGPTDASALLALDAALAEFHARQRSG